jgi:hypothetical protein
MYYSETSGGMVQGLETIRRNMWTVGKALEPHNLLGIISSPSQTHLGLDFRLILVVPSIQSWTWKKPLKREFGGGVLIQLVYKHHSHLLSFASRLLGFLGFCDIPFISNLFVSIGYNILWSCKERGSPRVAAARSLQKQENPLLLYSTTQTVQLILSNSTTTIIPRHRRQRIAWTNTVRNIMLPWQPSTLVVQLLLSPLAKLVLLLL